jgi:hypothetical protein
VGTLHHRVQIGYGGPQPPIQWVPGTLALGVKRPKREAGSLPYSAEVKECVELHFHSLNTPSWCGVQLNLKDKFTFTIYDFQVHMIGYVLKFTLKKGNYIMPIYSLINS